MATPDLTQKVIGFRQWHINEHHKLCPVGSPLKDPWKPGPQRAICGKSLHIAGESVPNPCIPVVQPYCECGFYALHTLSEAQWSGDNIRGIVLGWGRMAVHNLGWRAQFVELAALIYPLRPSKGEKAEVDKIAKNYNVPTISWEGAESYAKEFGDYMPESLKPKNWTDDELEADMVREQLWAEAKTHVPSEVVGAFKQGITEARQATIKVNRMIEEALEILDPEVPEAYAALHNIYVPNRGELLEGVVEGIVVDYIPQPDPVKPAEIKVDRNFELSISTNSTVLWLPLQAPVRHT